MFTGIITHIGKVEELKFNDALLKISVEKKIDRKLEKGCSIACNGICLTLIAKEKSGKKTFLSFQASEETRTKTTLQNWRKNQKINLEFALRIGDELGGHMVLGHVDGTAKIRTIKPIKNSYEFIFETRFMKFIAKKGSVVLDGVSLTVNETGKNFFSVNIIKHTMTNTTFQNMKIGDLVNLEIDPIARYWLK